MKIKFKILIVIAFFFTYAIGQERHGGKPLTFDIRTVNANGFKAANISLFSVANREYPVIDNEKELIKADSIAQLKGYEKNKFYGIGVPVNIYFKQAATVKPVGDSGKVYLLQLTSPTAYALQVYFDAFKIPKGSRMFIYDSNRTMYLGSFTNENNYVNNRFGTEFIKGNSLIIEYYEPNKVDFEAQLHIENLVHSFVDIKAGPFGYCVKLRKFSSRI
ncbi:MAG TPA: hypothetical protein PKX15_09095 [Bacteroidales bacterium]|nr:hypothetical protein [Bacteroidales bacterium]